jgi:ornithine cyclodeaminase/alanine dehydrogenase-like protein (mu-crystallin family)
MLVLDENTVRDLLTMQDAIDAVADSFRAISSSSTAAIRADVEDPQRSVRGLLLGTYAGELDGVCFKVVGNWRGVRSGVILVFDAATGEADVIVPSAHITDLRTGAASGAATRALARRDTAQLAMLGTGRQSTMQLEAMLAVRPFQTVTVWNRTNSTAESWIESVESRLPPGRPSFRLAPTPREACRDADVVVVATRATEPVLQGDWLRPGCHVNGIGASTPELSELAPSVMRRAGLVTVDCKQLALRTGDFMRALRDGVIATEEVAEIGEVLKGRLAGRTSEDEITVFKSVGHAANDLAVARMLARRARAEGRGIEVHL